MRGISERIIYMYYWANTMEIAVFLSLQRCEPRKVRPPGVTHKQKRSATGGYRDTNTTNKNLNLITWVKIILLDRLNDGAHTHKYHTGGREICYTMHSDVEII